MLDQTALEQKLIGLRVRYPQDNPDLVAEIVRNILSTMHGDLSASEAALLNEVEDLARTMASARAEIAALGADDITASHIPSATDELDAIVAHTATATDSILECCEQIDVVSSRLTGEDSTILQEVVTRVYEACSFQDITGQRITKIVATLKAIEAKVAQIIDVFAPDGARAANPAASALQSASPDSLLNGPQLPATAMDQSDIDALLASFE